VSDSLIPDLTPRPEAPANGGDRSVYVETYGCQMNSYDSQVILDRLRAAGFRTVDDHLAADLVLLNTCSVRELAEHKVISRVGEIRHQRREAGVEPAVMGVVGCMAERMGKQLLKGRNRVDLVVGVDHYDDLASLVNDVMGPAHARSAMSVGHDQSVHYVAPPALYPTNNSHLVTIHKGCDYRCTYCIVPYTRGPQVEKHPDLILTEIQAILDAGGHEVTLLGQNVTAYRWQGGELDFAGLLRLVSPLPGLERIRFLTGHPHDMRPHLIDTIADLPNVCPWLHVPAQSGSDEILKRMKRRYRRDDYLAMVAHARRVMPDVSFNGDFIVGFPGETEADFEQTLELVREVRYDTIFAFKYSERPGAPAAELDDDVSTDDKKRRLAALLAVQEEIWAEVAAEVVGTEVMAVVEEPARRPAGHWRLRTANNRKIVVDLPDGAPGQQHRLTITGWQNTSFFGEVTRS